MVNFTAKKAFDYNTFNLSIILDNLKYLKENNSAKIDGRSYESVYLVDSPKGPDFVLGGPDALSLSLTGSGKGGVSVLAQGEYNSATRNFISDWSMKSVVIDAAKLLSAAISAKPTDDAAVFKTIFSGHDTVTLSSGDDFFCSFEGNDIIDGGAGNDVLAGDKGTDRLTGGKGADVLIGGEGADRFLFKSIGDSPFSDKYRDMITDFTQGLDKIDLSAIDANVKAKGDQAFAFAAKKAAYSVWTEKVDHGLLVYADVNGSGDADFSILLNTTTISKSDFIL